LRLPRTDYTVRQRFHATFQPHKIEKSYQTSAG